MWAAVLGRPVAHSLSPALHNAAYAALGLTDWRYVAVTCGEAELPALLGRVRTAPQWAGLSLTMPLKAVAAGLCDDLRTGLGVINTITVAGGRLTGHNTDVVGIAAGLRALDVPLGRVALLGAGGTARAAVAALAAAGTTELSVHVRSSQRAAAVVAQAGAAGMRVTVAGLERLAAGVPTVSTLPATAARGLLVDGLAVDGPLLDVGYAPWPTPLAAEAARRGHRVVGGLTVLIAQAAEQVTLMTGRAAPLPAMHAAGEAALAAATT